MLRIARTTTTLVALTALTLSVTGCFDDSSTSPAPDASGAPTLPAPDRLTFDLEFFQEPATMERASKQNFFNAYLRATVAGAIGHLLVTPPVSAFAVALHTVPSPQDDGSYLWIYTWVNGDEEAQIRLRGRQVDASRVEWEMRVSSTYYGFENELWFEGETWSDANEGVWRFHDAERGGAHVARLEWGADAEGNFLRLVDTLDHPDDSLEYRGEGPHKSVTWTDADTPSESWYVRWNEVNGTGSLQAPDYNDGLPACWDDRQDDTECPTS